MRDLIGITKRPSQEDCDNGLAWAKTSLFRTVYPVIECADLVASEAMEWIIKKKDIDNEEVRKYARWGREEISKAVYHAQEDTDKDFVEEYAARIENKIYPDVLNIRNSLSIYLHRHKVKAAPTLCRLHTTEILLDTAHYVYERNDEIIFKETGYHYVRGFPQFDPKKAQYQWGRLCDVFYEHTPDADRTIDLNNDKKTVKLIELFNEKLYNSDLIDDVTNELVKDYTSPE